MNDTAIAAWFRQVEQAVWQRNHGITSTIGFLREFDRLHRASLALREPTAKADERQRKSANRSLSAWANDLRVQDFVAKHHIRLDRTSHWRWIDSGEIEGQINALPLSKGIPRITNGVYVYIERRPRVEMIPNGHGGFREKKIRSVFKGHIDWFTVTDEDAEVKMVWKKVIKPIRATQKTTKAKTPPAMADYISLL